VHTGADLPDDVESLKRLVLESRAALRTRELEIQHLKLLLAKLRRMQFGRSSEALDERIEQLELSIEELETSEAQAPPCTFDPPVTPKNKPVRKSLPANLPREPVLHAPVAPGCNCPACGGTLRALGEDVSEILEYVAVHFKVIRHIRPKLSCSSCQKIVQAAAPSRPIERGIAGPAITRPYFGREVLRSFAALPAEPDLCPRRH
jgi:hypothetical protein